MSADLANGILTLMNRERAAVGVQPLVWNDTAAAHAKAWAEYLAAGKTGALGVTHCIYVPGWEQIESCTHHEGENLVWYAPHDANRSASGLPQLLALRKEGLSRGTADINTGDRSLHADSLEYHEIRRLRNCGHVIWSERRHYVVPLLPGGQLSASPVLREPRSCHGKYNYHSVPRPLTELLQGISNGVVRRGRVLIISTFTPFTSCAVPSATIST